jgi:hypothetical protein
MSEAKPSIWIRNTLIVWGAVSAATVPLISAFQWLTRNEGILGSGPGALSKPAILINLCILCGVTTLIGLLIALIGVPVIAKQGKDFQGFGDRIGSILVALFVWVSYLDWDKGSQMWRQKGLPDLPTWPFVIIAIVTLTRGICSLIPKSLWEFLEESTVWSIALGIGLAVALVLVPTLRKPASYLWRTAGSYNSSNLTGISVGSVTVLGWLYFLFGVAAYSILYILFMEWRKRGKFLSSLFSQMDNKIPEFWEDFLLQAGWLQPAGHLEE